MGIFSKRFVRLVALACVPLAVAALLPVVAAQPGADQARLDQLEIAVVRAEDLRAIKDLQRRYGHYADRGLWNEMGDLFAEDAVANYPSGGFDGQASIRAMFVENLGQGKQGLADGRIYNHIILQPVVDLAADGRTATGRWRVLGMLGRFGGSGTWADSLYRFDYVKQGGQWKLKELTAYAGSGGGYATGWAKPQPRPPGAADRSPIRFNLAHPADRDWRDPCEQDVSVCVVPFPYPNRSEIRAPLKPAAVIDAGESTPRAADLVQRAQRLADEQAIRNLQNAYGYYIDRGLWRQAAELFAADGTREVGQAGVYVGRERIGRSLALAGPEGLRQGQLNDHLQLEPIIDVMADGTASARVLELAFMGGGGEPARIEQNIAENKYVKRGDAWQIQAMHVYTILVTDYDEGWGNSALPAPGPSTELPPDRPPTEVYEAYPKVFTPPFHAASAGAVPAEAPSRRALAAAGQQLQRVADWHEIENLMSAWGYYAEKSLWPDMAKLFTTRGVLQIDDARVAGRERILSYLQQQGPEGPVAGALNSQLVLQPVIHVAADGRSAKVRARVLQLSRDGQDRPMWGGAIFENELVKEEGVWKFSRLQMQRMYQVLYRGGWAQQQGGDGQLMPVRRTLPFHYRDVASGR